jgi:hypothetical protein
MDDLIVGAFYLLIISGAFALLALLDAGIQRFAEAFDRWQDEVFSGYIDDL